MERAQALMSINMCTRAEKDAIADLIGNFRFTTTLRPQPVPLRPARHRRAPRRDAAQVPPAGGEARAGRACSRSSAAPTPSASASTCRSAPCCSPRCPSTTGSGCGCCGPGSSTRSPAGPGGPASTPPASWWPRPPSTSIENEKALAKAGDDPKKRRKVVRKKAPGGLRRLVAGDLREADRLRSRAADLALPGHPRDAAVGDRPAGQRLRGDAPAAGGQPRGPRARSCGTSAGPSRSTARCWTAAWSSGSTEPDAEGRIVRLTVDLQQDFALNQPLSTFALASFELLDPESPSYALDMVSVVESTLDDPRQILAAQQNKARGEAVAADEGRRHRVRGAHGAAPGRHLPQAAGGAAAARLRRLPQEPPVGRRPPAVAQVRGPRHVRAGDDLHRVHLLLRARQGRGHRAALPGRAPTRRWTTRCPRT